MTSPRSDGEEPERNSAVLAGDTFEAAVGELAAALILAGEPVDSNRRKGSV